MSEYFLRKKICIIQNTDYHFETAIGLYSLFNKLGFHVFVYTCENVVLKNSFEQSNFYKQNKIETISLDYIDSDSIGVVVSAYPNSNERESVPNINDKIFNKIKKFIYICHRFKNTSDYLGNFINSKNSLCLSPLSEKIGIDCVWLLDCPIKPNHNFCEKNLKLTIQGHFEFNNRQNIFDIFNLKINKKINLNILGTNTNKVIKNLKQNLNFLLYEKIPEVNFYDICNNYTDFFIAAVDGETRNGAYLNERCSTTFIHAFFLEKPIFAHEIFKDIYKLPGIYYNKKNIQDKFEEMINIKKEPYNNLIKNFYNLKKEIINKNYITIKKKIKNITLNDFLINL